MNRIFIFTFGKSPMNLDRAREMFDIKKRFVGAIATQEDWEIVSAVHEFVENEIMPRRKDLEGGWHRDEKLARKTFEKLHKGLVDLGIQKAFMPEEIGGLGLKSTVTMCMLWEEIARGDAGLATHLAILPWVMGPALIAKRMDLLETFGRKICDDKPHTACMAITEPQGGTNIEDPTLHGRTIRTRAKLDGDEWVINGQKIWPSGAGVADICYCTVCTTDPSKGDEGIAIIYVPPDADGLSFGKPIEKMGLCWTDINAEIFYDNVRVPKEYRVAGPGEDAKILHSIVSGGRMGTAAMAVGVAQAVFEIVLEYTKNREIAGKSVREHSLHASILADMAIAIETARAYYLQVAWMSDRPRIYGKGWSPARMARASAAKVYACDVAVWVTNKAMELMGAYGYSFDGLVEKYLRDVKMLQLWLGGPQRGRLDVALGYYSFEW